MSQSKRKFIRFEVPLLVKFRPTYGATDYSMGVVTSISCEGLGLDAYDFRFIVYENVELIMLMHGNVSAAPLLGDIMWKKQSGSRCLAGIQFRMRDKVLQKEGLHGIFTSCTIPANMMYMNDLGHTIDDTPDRTNKPGLTKHYVDGGSRCTVTFRLLREIAGDTENVAIVGDFNNWDTSKSPMVRRENGDFTISLELVSKRVYRFNYLIDGNRWENDWHADKYARSVYGFKTSVVIV